MTIGEVAQLTGLSVKALRLYDEQGLLEPACVDSWSRYRRYTAAQLVPAVQLVALRRAGVGLADAARILTKGEPAEDVLAEFRARVMAERERQDAALAAAWAYLTAPARAWDLREREVAAQPWVGVVLPMDPETDEETATEQANEAFTASWHALAAVGRKPTGQCWSVPRMSEDGSVLELVCCWPVAGPPPEGWSVPGHTVMVGETPAGPELSVAWRHDDQAPMIDGAAHPALLALLAEVERRGVVADLSMGRQIVTMDETGEGSGVEFAVPLRRRDQDTPVS
ncbi:hypothetical protein Aut01nite_12380 [Actinoplanes utahensis]|nr:hypothetical protein Aut01nite_12380 [Actinoplanes utahensis]